MATARHGKDDKKPTGDIGITTGSDANSNSDKVNDEKLDSLQKVTTLQEGLVTVPDIESGSEIIKKPADNDDILTHTIHVEDDPSLNALTFRTFFLGIGLSLFGGTISTIYYFKPQTVAVSTVFLAVIIFILGEAMAICIPRWGPVGRFLNPHPFNIKEHVAITVMANAASISAQGIEVLAAEQLFYDVKLSGAVSVFLLFSSQFLGYGIAGLMRKVLVYPKAMLWPQNLPVNSMLETLHRNRAENRKPLKVFGIVFICIFCWEIIPEWIMPILTGFSIFCLAQQNSTVFTHIFGGAAGDEGLGLFSLCLDWQYISGGLSPLYFPLESLISQGLGICLCIVVFSAAYYGNVWRALDFPFLSQEIFSDRSTANNAILWNQRAVIGADNRVQPDLVAKEGLPYFATSYAINILVTNMSVPAAIVHICLYYWTEVSYGFEWLRPKHLAKSLNPRNWNLKFWENSAEHPENREHYDPHYRLMFSYKAVPNWWFLIVLALSFTIGMIIIYEGHSTLPWWGFIVAMLIGYVFLIFFGAMQAISGVQFLVQPIVQMIGGYIQPGNPVANMYFSLYGYNALIQGQLLSQDLKLAQYGHLAPRITFTCQMLGTAVGVVMTYVMSNNIIKNRFAILISPEGSNIWSGQQAQAFNSLAVTWGGLSHELFSVGGRYQWMTLIYFPGFVAPLPLYFAHRKWPHKGFDKINISIVILYVSWLCVGINSSLMMFFFLGFASQFWIRRKYPNVFVKYNYLISAALDGGTSVIVFIMSFAIFGAAGNPVNFPQWWGNNLNGNADRCVLTP